MNTSEDGLDHKSRVWCRILIVLVLTLALAASGAEEAQAQRTDGDVPILMYHSVDPVADPEWSEWFVSADLFTNQMEALQAYGYDTVTLQDYLNYRDGSAIPPDHPIILTFDDGFQNFYTYARPILSERNMVATLFIPTGMIGETYQDRVSNHLVWYPEVQTLYGEGFQIESHTISHPYLTQIPGWQAQQEITDSRADIQNHLGNQALFFCYPYGDGAYDPTIRSYVQQAGYQAAVAAWPDGIANTATSDIWALPRIYIGEIHSTVLDPEYPEDFFLRKVDPYFPLPMLQIDSVQTLDNHGHQRSTFYPGEWIQVAFHISNSGDETDVVATLKLDIDTDDTMPPLYDSSATQPSEDISFSLAHGQSTDLIFYYQLPPDATTGLYYYALGLHDVFKVLDFRLEGWTELFIVEPLSDTQPPQISHVPVVEAAEYTPIIIQAEILDDVGVSEARVFYRASTGSAYTWVVMEHLAGDVWQTVIPGSDVTTAGVDYYIWASDGPNDATHGTHDAPHTVSVSSQPDTDPPQITHTPVSEASPGVPLTISATVTDNRILTDVILYYRVSGTTQYIALQVTEEGGDIWQAVVPGEALTLAGLDYFLYASDGTNETLHGSPANPHTVSVTEDMPILEANPLNLSFVAQVDGANPEPQGISIANTGGGTLSWSVSNNAAWLTLYPTSGTGDGMVTVEVDITGLTAGFYPTHITAQASDAVNSPQSISVALEILPPPGNIVINEVDVGDYDAVELYNAGNNAAAMTGWHFLNYDENGNLYTTYTFPAFTLQPGTHVVVHENSGIDTATDLYTGMNIWWVLDAGAAALTDGSSTGVDFMRWGTSSVAPPYGTDWSGANPPAPALGWTLGRNPASADTDGGSDWCSQFSSLGAQNVGCGPSVPNDDSDNALAVTSVPYSNVQDTTGATTAVDDPTFACISGQNYNTVWYRYTPSASGILSVDTFGSAYNTVLAVWTGTQGNLTSVACNDDNDGTLQSQVEVSVSAGTTYHIEVAGRHSESYGPLYLSVSLSPICYTLTTDVSPSGGGNVDVSPSPNCSDGKYTEGTVVQLMANPTSGHGFSDWSGGASSGVNPITITMDEDRSVTANFCALPAVPSLSSPADSSSTSDKTPHFDWSPVSGVTLYRIQVDDDSSFSSPEIDTTTSDSNYTPESPLLPDPHYYWRVQASNSCGSGSWSAVWAFTTPAPAPAPSGSRIYLPIVANNRTPPVPDLVVERLIVAGSGVQVVVKNQGDLPVTDEFWVDLYVDPDPVPTRVNQVWNDLCEEGLAWGVNVDALPLEPGDAITLTVGDDYYWPSLSRISWPLPTGTPVYAQVDSANADTTYGAVLEGHEIVGGAYNNISGLVYPSAGIGGSSEGGTAHRGRSSANSSRHLLFGPQDINRANVSPCQAVTSPPTWCGKGFSWLASPLQTRYLWRPALLLASHVSTCSSPFNYYASF